MKYYQYLFYKIYSFTKKLGDWELAFKVMCGLSVLPVLNILKVSYILSPKRPLLSSSDYDNILFIIWYSISNKLLSFFTQKEIQRNRKAF